MDFERFKKGRKDLDIDLQSPVVLGGIGAAVVVLLILIMIVSGIKGRSAPETPNPQDESALKVDKEAERQRIIAEQKVIQERVKQDAERAARAAEEANNPTESTEEVADMGGHEFDLRSSLDEDEMRREVDRRVAEQMRQMESQSGNYYNNGYRGGGTYNGYSGYNGSYNGGYNGYNGGYNGYNSYNGGYNNNASVDAQREINRLRQANAELQQKLYNGNYSGQAPINSNETIAVPPASNGDYIDVPPAE